MPLQDFQDAAQQSQPPIPFAPAPYPQPSPASSQGGQSLLDYNPPVSPPVGGTADLENVAGQAPTALVQSLQTQQQNQQPNQPAQSGGDDPLAPMLTQLMAKYQAQQPPPQSGGGIKRLLTSFVSGAGNSMMREVGLPTPDMQSQQTLSQILTLSQVRNQYLNSQSEAQLRAAQVANLNRAVTPEQAHLLGMDQLAGQVVPADVMSGISQERNFQQNTPTLQIPLDANTAKIAGIPQQFVGQNLSSADWKLVEGRLNALGYQKFDTGTDGKGQGKGIWIIDRAGNPVNQISTTSESNRAIKALTAGQSPVYAYNPATNETVLTTQGQAQGFGMQNVRPVKESDIRGDLHDTRVLNDVAAKANQVYNSATAMDDKSLSSTLGAAKYLADNPNSTWNQLVQSGIMGNTPQPTKNYIQDVMSLRESAMGLQKVLTGSARSNETQIHALLNTLPALEPDSGTVRSKLQRFGQNITLLRQGIPRMAGIDIVPIQGGQSSPITNPNASFNWNALPVAKP